MENAYQPALWRDVYVMLGTSVAALIGLTFVVTSLHLDEIMNNAIYRIRARNNMYYLMALLVQATLILIPQPMVALGVELIAINSLLLLFHLRNLYHFQFRDKEMASRGGFQLHVSFRFVASDLVGIAGGIFLVNLSNWGLYLVTASYVAFLSFVILNTWVVMLGVGQAEKTTKASRRRV